MKPKYILSLVIAAALSAAVLIAQVPPAGPMKGMIQGDKSRMTEMHQKMEAEMKAQDAELDRLVAEMSAATGDRKVDAVAAVVAKLVEQRKAMHSQMSGMHGDMMDAMECCKSGKGMMGHDMMSSPTPAGH